MTERHAIPGTAKRMRALNRHLNARQALAFAAAAIGLVALHLIFFETVAATVWIWITSSTFNHGFMIPILVGYLVWQRREQLAVTAPRFEILGLIAFALGAALWLVGKVIETTIIQQGAFVIMVASFVHATLGRHVTRVLRFPLLYLVFTVPFGAELVPYLQDVTAFFVVFFMQNVGIPIYIDGVFLATPAGNYRVAEACSGIRYLISTIALGTFFAHMVYRSWVRQAFFIALSVVVPIIANGVRAFLIVLIAYLSNNEIAVGIDHIIYGWIFFSFVTFLLLGLGLLMRERGAVCRAKVQPQFVGGSPSTFGPVAGTLATVALAALTLIYAHHLTTPVAGAKPPAFTAAAIAGIAPEEQSATGWYPRFVNPDAEYSGVVPFQGRRVYLDIGYYMRERAGAKALTSDHDFGERATWHPMGSGSLKLDLGDHTLAVRTVRMRSGAHFKLVWYWYWVGGEFVGDPYTAKYRRMRSLLFGGPTATAVVSINTDYFDSSEQPERILQAFLRDNVSALRAMLDQANRP